MARRKRPVLVAVCSTRRCSRQGCFPAVCPSWPKILRKGSHGCAGGLKLGGTWHGWALHGSGHWLCGRLHRGRGREVVDGPQSVQSQGRWCAALVGEGMSQELCRCLRVEALLLGFCRQSETLGAFVISPLNESQRLKNTPQPPLGHGILHPCCVDELSFHKLLEHHWQLLRELRELLGCLGHHSPRLPSSGNVGQHANGPVLALFLLICSINETVHGLQRCTMPLLDIWLCMHNRLERLPRATPSLGLLLPWLWATSLG
mmetsp:Transcript_17414/g.50862  ORF Transcript_17414/g.50862 Transcript_17414/m.50862 type:complete len:260 (+) Transcript_17414:609-1388(+)